MRDSTLMGGVGRGKERVQGLTKDSECKAYRQGRVSVWQVRSSTALPSSSRATSSLPPPWTTKLWHGREVAELAAGTVAVLPAQVARTVTRPCLAPSPVVPWAECN